MFMLIIEAGLEYILIKSWDSIEIQITPWRFYSSYKMQRNSEIDVIVSWLRLPASSIKEVMK